MAGSGHIRCKVPPDGWDHLHSARGRWFKAGGLLIGSTCLTLFYSIATSVPPLPFHSISKNDSISLIGFPQLKSVSGEKAPTYERQVFQISGRNIPQRSLGKSLAYHPHVRQRPIFATGQKMGTVAGMDDRFFMQRIIRLGGQVTDESATQLVLQMLYLEAMDPKKGITMYINSPGGSVTAGMAIFDTMNLIQPEVSTVCAGLAASMGAFLLSAGQKGKRYAYPNSRIMIHQPLGGAGGSVSDITRTVNEIMHHKRTLNRYLSDFTGQTIEQMEQDTDRDNYMSAAEAVEYGLIDRVITSPPALP